MSKKEQFLGSKSAFTLAEMLITLSVIGIVAALTIPGVVKHHNEKAWAAGKDLFTKKLDVAMKQMNTDGTLRGYATTEDFVNALKKNIKITQVCKDDPTKCFAKTIQWRQFGAPVTLTSSNTITLKSGDAYDWAEPIGVRFANGVNAILAYNKNCSEDPFNNQYSPMTSCIGIIYDVSGNTKPNKNGSDIASNGNIEKLAGQSGCEYQLKNGTCFAKILGPRNGGYTYLTNAECTQAKADGKIDVDYCQSGSVDRDYFAGAVLACGGKKANLPTPTILQNLAQEIYNINDIALGGDTVPYDPNGLCMSAQCVEELSWDTTKAAPFLAQGSSTYEFLIWSNFENTFNYFVGVRGFSNNHTYHYDDFFDRTYGQLAVCLGD